MLLSTRMFLKFSINFRPFVRRAQGRRHRGKLLSWVGLRPSHNWLTQSGLSLSSADVGKEQGGVSNYPAPGRYCHEVLLWCHGRQVSCQVSKWSGTLAWTASSRGSFSRLSLISTLVKRRMKGQAKCSKLKQSLIWSPQSKQRCQIRAQTYV